MSEVRGNELTGYLHPAYATSLEEFGAPRHLPRSDGWLLVRPIGDGRERDAMGCYPIFACRDWSKLGADLAEAGQDLVSIVLIADPFGAPEPAALRDCFTDLVRPFKEHFIVDLAQPLTVDPHHRRYARKALRALDVDRVVDPARLAAEWSELYAWLIARHGITGISAFSPRSFERQLRVPGMVMFSARNGEEIVAMSLWYVRDDVAYYHLGASNEHGYQQGASFGMFAQALEYLIGAGVRWLDLGGGAGVTADAADGLSRFKRGWSTGTRTAYLCGRIFDRQQYDRLTRERGVNAGDYFPAYRTGEFA